MRQNEYQNLQDLTISGPKKFFGLTFTIKPTKTELTQSLSITVRIFHTHKPKKF